MKHNKKHGGARNLADNVGESRLVLVNAAGASQRSGSLADGVLLHLAVRRIDGLRPRHGRPGGPMLHRQLDAKLADSKRWDGLKKRTTSALDCVSKPTDAQLRVGLLEAPSAHGVAARCGAGRGPPENGLPNPRILTTPEIAPRPHIG